MLLVPEAKPMTITKEQLVELDALGRSNPDRDFVLSGPVTLQLVAIARAALAYVKSDDEDRVAEFEAMAAALGVQL